MEKKVKEKKNIFDSTIHVLGLSVYLSVCLVRVMLLELFLQTSLTKGDRYIEMKKMSFKEIKFNDDEE